MAAVMLVFALAVPASAATWRTDASMRANAGWQAFARVTTQPRTWKSINVRVSSTRMDECSFSGSAHPTGFSGSYQIKLRVR